jgi:ABC-type branched-subunit amino acid transport system substrate-binding protein
MTTHVIQAQTKPRRGGRLALAVLATAGLLLAACGDDGDGATTDTTPDASSGPETGDNVPTGEPIRLLLIQDGEDTPVHIPVLSDGATAAAAAINEAGGVNGRPIEIDECDSRLDPNAAADCARQAETGGYAAIVGSLTSTDAAIVPVAEEAGIAMIGLVPTTAASYASANSFPISQGSSVKAVALSRAVVEGGATKISFLYIDVPSAAAFVPVLEGGVAQNGAELGRSVGVPPGAPDMSSYVANALDGGVDGLVLFTTAGDAAKMVQAVRDSGADDIVMGFAVSNSDELIDALGPDADGLVTASPQRQVSESDVPGVQQYVEEMEASGLEPVNNEYAFNSWASVHLFAEVAASLTDITADTVLAAMATATYDSGGLYPALDYAHPVTDLPISPGAPRIFTSEVEFVVVENGELVPTSDFVDLVGCRGGLAHVGGPPPRLPTELGRTSRGPHLLVRTKLVCGTSKRSTSWLGLSAAAVSCA